MKGNSRVIYVDLDDVLCEAARHFLVIVEREFGKRTTYEQLVHFDVGRACGLRPEERAELYRIVHRQDELLRMAPIDAAMPVLKKWQEEGFEIAIVTGRPPEAYEASLEWLARHRVAYNTFTIVDKYSRFETDRTLAISLRELAERKFRYAVEDSLPMAQYLAVQMSLPVALIDCPWNRTILADPGVNRYPGWLEIGARPPG